MRTVTTTVYLFSELSDRAKEKALDVYRDWNVNTGRGWWESVYEDADRAGLEIQHFDLYRGTIGGRFTGSALDCAESIMAEHGPDCETFKTASEFMRDRTAILDKWAEDGEDEIGPEGEDEIESLEKDFLHSILEDYRIMLGHEYDYLTSDEAVAESLEVNGVEFTEDGRRA